MKALTISQPWASLIASGEKWVENRTWRTSYRGPIAIHAGKGNQYLSRQELARHPTGCIVATANLVACLYVGPGGARSSDFAELDRAGIAPRDVLAHKYTDGPYCWVLKDIEKLDKPIPARGAPGLWDVILQTNAGVE